MINNFTTLLERTLVPIASKLSNNKYLVVISTVFSYTLPVIIMGALFSLAATLNI